MPSCVSNSNVLVPTTNELMPATWRVAAGAKARVARSFFPATPNIRQHYRLDRNQRDSIFRQPLVGCFDRVIETLVAAFLEKARSFDFFRNKIFVLQHRILNFREPASGKVAVYCLSRQGCSAFSRWLSASDTTGTRFYQTPYPKGITAPGLLRSLPGSKISYSFRGCR